MSDPPVAKKSLLETHRLVKSKFNKAVNCKICGKPIRGLGINSGFICAICAIPIHKSCASKAKKSSCLEAALAQQYEPFIPVVRENCLINFQRLLYEAQRCDCDIPKKLKPLIEDIMKATAPDFSPNLAIKINQIWNAKVIHNIYDEFGKKWQIVENSDYFFDHVLRIASAGYLPNTQDILRAKPTQDRQATYKDKIFKVWLPKGAKIEFPYNEEENLGEILKQVKQQKSIPDDPPYIAWDSNGTILDGLDNIPLAQLETLEIYYFPEGTKPLSTPLAKKQRRISGNPLPKDARRMNGILSNRTVSSLKNSGPHADKRTGILSVSIVEAINLANDHESLEYVYVVVSDGMGEKRYRTIPVANARNSKITWDQNFKFTILTNHMEFMFKVWATHFNKATPDIMLGQSVFLVESLHDGDKKTEDLKLKKEVRKYKVNKKQPGSLQISWQYNDKKLKVEKKIEVPVEGETPGDKPTQPLKKILEEVYEVGEKLGEGAFSVVKVGVHKENGSKVAIKILDNYSNIENAEEDVLRFQQETSIIKSLDHKNIVKLYDIFEDHEHYYVVMELVSGGELFDQIVLRGFYPEDETILIIQQILGALSYLEDKKICHRDLKPENLIFTDDTHTNLKLIDFGEAKSCAEGLIREYVGTTDYMAPEIIKGGEYDNRVDMWSLGVVTYVMLCGFPPWEGESESDVFVNIMTLQYDFPSPEWDDISDGAKDFVTKLLSNYEDRLTAKQARKHPWIMSQGQQPLAKLTLNLSEQLYSNNTGIEKGLVDNLANEINQFLNLQVEETETLKEKNGALITTVSFNKK